MGRVLTFGNSPDVQARISEANIDDILEERPELKKKVQDSILRREWF